MLKNTLTHIPQIVLLRSDKILNTLITLLSENKHSHQNDFPEIMEGVRDFYPNSYRLDEMELSLSQSVLKESDISSDLNFKKFKDIDYNFSFLDKLYDKFLMQDGANIYAREEVLESYLGFISKVSPLQIIGYRFARELKEDILTQNDVFAFVNAYTPLALEVDKINEYAENHLHLKGAGYLGFNFIKLLSYDTPKAYYHKSFLQEIPRINEFSFINNSQISIGQIVNILKLSKDFIYSSFMSNKLDDEEYQNRLQKIMIYNQSFGDSYIYSMENLNKIEKIFSLSCDSVELEICKKVIKLYNEDNYSKAYLMEYVLIFYIYQTTQFHCLQRVIKLYLHATNILRSYMLMSQNLGLAHFSEFSGSTLREVERRNAHNTARSIISSGTTHLNAKIGSATASYKIERNILDFKNAFDGQEKKIKAFNFGLSSLKNREKSIEIHTGELLPRFYNKRIKIKEESLAIDDFVRNVKYKIVDKFDTALKFTQIEAYKQKDSLQNETFDISSYVVSLDAVGKETHTPPEVFAPHFRYLRNAPKSLKNNIFNDLHTFNYHPNLLITVHAGEDFNHIVTGMRRVDETIEFFEMQRRDRLGHVLSLGIRPQSWIESVQELVVYKGDYFDDLVWLCQKLKQISCRELDLSHYIHIYTDKIWKLFSELYPMCKQSLHINDLYQAWTYRKNCPITYYQRERGETLFGEYDQRVLDDRPSKEVKEIYELYQSNKKVREAYQNIIKIDKSKIDKEELEVWELVQDKILDEIAQKGIIIETNPSSNIFISFMKGYAYHPIFRFYPPKSKYLKKGKRFNRYGQRNGRISITINSDDPAIFATSLQNEYKTIKNIAKKRYNCSDKEADDWLDDIRRFGITIFKECEYGRIE